MLLKPINAWGSAFELCMIWLWGQTFHLPTPKFSREICQVHFLSLGGEFTLEISVFETNRLMVASNGFMPSQDKPPRPAQIWGDSHTRTPTPCTMWRWITINDRKRAGRKSLLVWPVPTGRDTHWGTQAKGNWPTTDSIESGRLLNIKFRLQLGKTVAHTAGGK